MAILNLTQHNATAEQRAAGVIDLKSNEAVVLRRQLTFNTIPTRAEMLERAADIAAIAAANASAEDRGDNEGFALSAMIGGAGFFMRHLEDALLDVGIQPLHAFSVRESVETVGSDGSVTKTNVFKHVDFVGNFI